MSKYCKLMLLAVCIAFANTAALRAECAAHFPEWRLQSKNEANAATFKQFFTEGATDGWAMHEGRLYDIREVKFHDASEQADILGSINNPLLDDDGHVQGFVDLRMLPQEPYSMFNSDEKCRYNMVMGGREGDSIVLAEIEIKRLDEGAVGGKDTKDETKGSDTFAGVGGTLKSMVSILGNGLKNLAAFAQKLNFKGIIAEVPDVIEEAKDVLPHMKDMFGFISAGDFASIVGIFPDFIKEFGELLNEASDVADPIIDAVTGEDDEEDVVDPVIGGGEEVDDEDEVVNEEEDAVAPVIGSDEEEEEEVTPPANEEEDDFFDNPDDIFEDPDYVQGDD